ncbi:MAG TPA: hypothetical protein VLL54_13155 [Pyrinomonadaceae bacterium]|nr:hypothetical protein [Pyrinomonadaceae bacterium]
MRTTVIPQILCAGILASTAVIAVQAQYPGGQRGIDPEMEQRQRDLKLLDRSMRAREETKTTPRRDPKVVNAEIAEDFTRIQVIDNDLLAAAAGSAPLNLEVVVKSAAELAERTKRLGENLGHPEAEKGDKPTHLEPATDLEQLKLSLASLDKLLTEFTHNPLFTDANTRDAELLVKARRDLADLTALSEHIKKDAEALSKTAKQSP